MKLFQGVLAFALAVTEDDRSNVTSHAGVPLVVSGGDHVSDIEVLRLSQAHLWAEVIGRARQALLALKRASRAGPLPAC